MLVMDILAADYRNVGLKGNIHDAENWTRYAVSVKVSSYQSDDKNLVGLSTDPTMVFSNQFNTSLDLFRNLKLEKPSISEEEVFDKKARHSMVVPDKNV